MLRVILLLCVRGSPPFILIVIQEKRVRYIRLSLYYKYENTLTSKLWIHRNIKYFIFFLFFSIIMTSVQIKNYMSLDGISFRLHNCRAHTRNACKTALFGFWLSFEENKSFELIQSVNVTISYAFNTCFLAKKRRKKKSHEKNRKRKKTRETNTTK
jgi:hypothetical protein